MEYHMNYLLSTRRKITHRRVRKIVTPFENQHFFSKYINETNKNSSKKIRK